MGRIAHLLMRQYTFEWHHGFATDASSVSPRPGKRNDDLIVFQNAAEVDP